MTSRTALSLAPCFALMLALGACDQGGSEPKATAETAKPTAPEPAATAAPAAAPNAKAPAGALAADGLPVAAPLDDPRAAVSSREM